ncbi:MAG TPA: tRNA pseudouridine(55) synthase TruB [Gemmatimonadaceae bacterium]
MLIDKPAGITSHDAVAVVRRATHSRRVGHAGTLDPFATGLLVVLVGRGTRLIPYAEGEPKVYEATIRFGAETDTDDCTGECIRSAPAPRDDVIGEAIARLTGEIEQLPPAYSAKQVGGTRAYAAARRGAALELSPARVTVHEWTVTGRSGDDVRATITCGGGTYVRALARDLGRLTNSAAHLASLRRTHAGPFAVRDAISVNALGGAEAVMQPLLACVPSLPVRRLDAAELRRVSHGNAIALPMGGESSVTEGARVALVDDEDTLIAVAERRGSILQPTLVLRDG